MNKSLKWKFLLLFFCIIYSGVTLLPSVYSGVPDWWKRYLAPEGLSQGLDLQGGMHIILKVNLDKAIENALNFATDDLKSQLKEKKITVVKMDSGDRHKVLFTLPNKKSLPEIQAMVRRISPT